MKGSARQPQEQRNYNRRIFRGKDRQLKIDFYNLYGIDPEKNEKQFEEYIKWHSLNKKLKSMYDFKIKIKEKYSKTWGHRK